MSVDATRWAWQQKTGKATAKVVLLSLADRAGENNECWPSISRLEADTELDRKTIFSAIFELEKLGLIAVEKSVGKGNKYTLIGVVDRHETRTKNGTTTSTKIGTSPKNGTSTKNGTTTRTENGTTTSTENGIQNLSIEPSIEPINVICANKAKKARFVKPAIDEISAYCQERQNGICADRFFDYYEARGWLIGKNPMKDWKAAVRTWEQRSDTPLPSQPTTTTAADPYAGFKVF